MVTEEISPLLSFFILCLPFNTVGYLVTVLWLVEIRKYLLLYENLQNIHISEQVLDPIRDIFRNNSFNPLADIFWDSRVGWKYANLINIIKIHI